MDEFVVRGGLVYDGTGAPPAQADVWVRDGEIMAVGVDAGGSDIPAVDASGCVVTPGFVDIHRHCDAAPLRDADFGRVELAQGITCALAGNCGLAPVPLDVSRHGEFYEYIEPVVGKVPPHVCYNSYAGYVRALEQTELPLHLGFLAGIGAVRCAVKGFSAQPFTKRELEQAVALVDQAMEAGACGRSFTANIPAGTIWSPPSDGSASSSVRWRERNTHGIRGKTLSGQRRCTAVGIRRT